MKCCGQEVTSVELKVAGEPVALVRCGDCNSRHWMRDGEQIPFAEVTRALRDETMAVAASQAERRASRQGHTL